MKTSSLTIALSLTFLAASAFADKAGYQSAILSQSPFYFNHFDSSLAPSMGTGTFSATAGATYGSDAWGNANNAVWFAAIDIPFICRHSAKHLGGVPVR